MKNKTEKNRSTELDGREHLPCDTDLRPHESSSRKEGKIN